MYRLHNEKVIHNSSDPMIVQRYLKKKGWQITGMTIESWTHRNHKGMFELSTAFRLQRGLDRGV